MGLGVADVLWGPKSNRILGYRLLTVFSPPSAGFSFSNGIQRKRRSLQGRSFPLSFNSSDIYNLQASSLYALSGSAVLPLATLPQPDPPEKPLCFQSRVGASSDIKILSPGCNARTSFFYALDCIAHTRHLVRIASFHIK